MNFIDVTIIIGSLVIIVLVGLWASRGQDKTAKGYFLASGKMPWWLIGAGFVATSVSSEQIVGTVGATYTYGMGIANWEWFAPNKFFILAMGLKPSPLGEPFRFFVFALQLTLSSDFPIACEQLAPSPATGFWTAYRSQATGLTCVLLFFSRVRRTLVRSSRLT